MIIHTLIVGIVETNCYIVETDNKNAVIIDCGDEADRILQFVEEKGLTVKQIFLTHGHFDHICAVADIVLKTGAEVFVHEKDAPMLINANLSLASAVPVIKFKPVTNYNLISDGDVIALDELEFKVMHTPGHTSGGVCYICGGAIFSGDTLFAGTVGRVDLPNGSFNEILKSVAKLAALHGNYTVYSGHGNATTLDIERETNVYIKGTYDDNSF